MESARSKGASLPSRTLLLLGCCIINNDIISQLSLIDRRHPAVSAVAAEGEDGVMFRAPWAAEGKPKPATSSAQADRLSLTPEDLLALKNDVDLDQWLMGSVGDAQYVLSPAILSSRLADHFIG